MEHLYKIACVLLLASCSDEDAALPDVPDDPDFPAPPDGEGLQLVSAVRIEPGQEVHACRYLVLPDRELEIAKLQHHYTAGSHHMLLYPTSKRPSEVDDGTVFDCLAAGDLGATGVIYGSSVPDGELPYPDGIALELAPRSVVLLETHYLNPADTALDAVARINLWFTTQPATIEAGTLFFRDWAVYLPPTGAETRVAMRCQIPQQIELLYATSHMHRRGTTFESTVDGEPIHVSDRWDSPTPSVYWPPRQIDAGSTIEFSCGYRNTDGRVVIEGPSAETDEMCVFVGGYWPRLPADAELCLADGSGPVLAGNRTCEQTVDCMVDAGVDNWVGGQQCVTETCAGSAEALSSFVVCVERNDCWGDPTCVAGQCPQQWDSCTRARCD